MKVEIYAIMPETEEAAASLLSQCAVLAGKVDPTMGADEAMISGAVVAIQAVLGAAADAHSGDDPHALAMAVLTMAVGSTLARDWCCTAHAIMKLSSLGGNAVRIALIAVGADELPEGAELEAMQCAGGA